MSIRKIKLYNRKTGAADNTLDAILAPAKIFEHSFGLHPFEIIEVEDKKIKTELLAGISKHKAAINNSHLIVFAIKPVITTAHISDFFSELKTAKKITGQSLSSYRKHIEEIIRNSGDGWTSKQANTALTILSSSIRQAGAELTVFNIADSSLFNKKLHLEEKGLMAHVAVKIDLQSPKDPWLFPDNNKN